MTVTVDAFPDRVAVACGEREMTYAELEETANRLAHFLRHRGVGKGAHVGLYAGNSIEAVVAMIAVYKLRAVVVNVNYRYVENELQYPGQIKVVVIRETRAVDFAR